MQLGAGSGSVFLSLGAIALVALTAACVVEHDHRYDDDYGDDDSNATTTNVGPPDASANATVTPITVVVDTGKTLNAAPGQGLGVFVEYATGGHWHVWWTCDTSISGQTCQFNNTVRTVDGSPMSDVLAEGNALSESGSDGGTSSATYASTTGASSVDGVNFDTTPGSKIQVSSTIGGTEPDALGGQYFFFVQNGKVNGGYTGTLSDPLDFAPSAP